MLQRCSSRPAGRGVVLLCAATLLLPLAAVEAQQTGAAVSGRVRDAQGGVLAGVAVVVQNVDTNVALHTTTDAAGDYRAMQLAPGRYRVTGTRDGFRSFVREGIVLRTAETATVDMRLELGPLEDAVTVHAELAATESNQGTLAQTMENKRVSELPLNGRQVYMLLQLTSGAFFTQSQFGSNGFSGTRAWDVNGSVMIHGSRTGNNEFLIDGAPGAGSSQGAGGSWNYAPPVDAVEEFRVQAAAVDASYGRTSGGVVNLTLRSGGNDLRGSLTSHYRGNALDANQIQNIRNGITQKGHEFVNGEAMLSGPLRRDRTFFMVGYQGFYEDIPFPTTRTVPTDLQRQGDFSQTFNGAGRLIVIYDPLTTRPDPERPGRFIRDPFPGNRVPPERWSPVARALLPYIPAANAAGTPTGADNFINSPNLGRYRYNSYLVRLEHRFDARHRASLTHSANWGSEFRNENGLPEPALRSDNYPTHRNHYLATVDDTLTFGARMLLNTRISVDRFDEPHEKLYGGVDPELPFETPYQVMGPPFPHVAIDGYQDMFPQTYRRVLNHALSAQSTLSRVVGAHALKLGAQFRAYRFYRSNNGDGNGDFRFSRGFTQRDPAQGDAAAGAAFASFLLGFPSGGGVDVNADSDRRYLYYAVFLQDDWKLGARATLNLGLRWDYQPPVTERRDRQVVGFDGTSPNPFQVPGLPLRGGLLFAGRDGNPRSPYRGDWNNLQPRLGISYKITQRLVGRASYGRSYLGLTGTGQEGVITTDFSRGTGIVGPQQTGIPFTRLQRPFPDGFLQPRQGSLGLATAIGSDLAFYDPGFDVPRSDQWMAGVDLELPWRVSVNLAYVGNRVSALPVGVAINEVARAEREKAIEALGGRADYLSERVPNPFAGLLPGTGFNNPTISRGQLLRPYPQFGDITEERRNLGRTQYHALEMTATKRFSHGLHAVVNYTLSRLREATGFLNNGYDGEVFESLSGQDRTHRLVITALYDLPFGPGRALGGSSRGLLAGLLGGWQLNVIGEIQSGTPVGRPGGLLREASVALPKGERCLGTQRGCRWFDNSTSANPNPDGSYAWEQAPPNAFRTWGSVLPDVRNPSAASWSLSLFKTQRLGDTALLQLRAEAFNVFNVRVYGGPSTGITSASFGQVSTASQNNFPRQVQLGFRLLFGPRR